MEDRHRELRAKFDQQLIFNFLLKMHIFQSFNLMIDWHLFYLFDQTREIIIRYNNIIWNIIFTQILCFLFTLFHFKLFVTAEKNFTL